ncbi:MULTISPECIES: amidohydrolase family protein [unclassified Nocardia]|uniref:amidohydrolase family protein n=1 Tax=unclassified Nocardia TaxID=2637762 RepID=UPI0024A8456F|nr:MULTISPECIES: amidohydrolase family protein [unclassified Nocardia]
MGAVGAAVGSVMGGGRAHADDGAPVRVLSGATLIEGTDAAPLPGAAIVLAGDRILAVGRQADIPLPPGVPVVDLAGKFVIPGLWDMHVHQTETERIFPPLHVVHGVTGIREMWGTPRTRDLRRRIELGQAFGPRMVVASNIIDGPPGIWPQSQVVATEADGRAAVRQAQRDGADFVKVYSLLSRETYLAVADESHRAGLRFAGHLPTQVAVGEAVDMGQHTLEHMIGMLVATSSRAAELHAELRAMDPSTLNVGTFAPLLEQTAAQTFSPDIAEALADRMIRRGTWLSPTLVVMQRFLSGGPPGDPSDDRLRYMPPSFKTWWQNLGAQSEPAPIRAAMQANHRARVRVLGAMHAAGVGIVAGTDCANPFVFPGFALHEELELLVQAGLPPLRALQAATRDAARCLGMEHLTGTVEPGKFADLVVLDADPLAAITNTTRIHAVVSRGRYLGPEDRTRILRDVEAAAAADTTGTPVGGFHACCG